MLTLNFHFLSSPGNKKRILALLLLEECILNIPKKVITCKLEKAF